MIPFAANAAAKLQRPLQRRLPMLLNCPDNPRKLLLPLGGSTPLCNTWFLGATRVFIQNGISIGSAVFAQLTVECPITLQWASTFSQKIAPFRRDFVTLPEENRVTAIGNIQKLVKIAHVFRAICSRTDKQTHTQTCSLQYFTTVRAGEVIISVQIATQ